MINETIDLTDLEENDDEDSYPLEYFNLTATPNDFNISTIISFMERKVFQIPLFKEILFGIYKNHQNLLSL